MRYALKWRRLYILRKAPAKPPTARCYWHIRVTPLKWNNPVSHRPINTTKRTRSERVFYILIRTHVPNAFSKITNAFARTVIDQSPLTFNNLLLVTLTGCRIFNVARGWVNAVNHSPIGTPTSVNSVLSAVNARSVSSHLIIQCIFCSVGHLNYLTRQSTAMSRYPDSSHSSLSFPIRSPLIYLYSAPPA